MKYFDYRFLVNKTLPFKITSMHPEIREIKEVVFYIFVNEWDATPDCVLTTDQKKLLWETKEQLTFYMKTGGWNFEKPTL